MCFPFFVKQAGKLDKPSLLKFYMYGIHFTYFLFSSCRTIFDDGELLEFAKLGSYLEYDLFGTEMLNYPYNLEVDMPSDSQRVKA